MRAWWLRQLLLIVVVAALVAVVAVRMVTAAAAEPEPPFSVWEHLVFRCEGGVVLLHVFLVDFPDLPGPLVVIGVETVGVPHIEPVIWVWYAGEPPIPTVVLLHLPGTSPLLLGGWDQLIELVPNPCQKLAERRV